MILAYFRHYGTTPYAMEKLNSRVSNGTTLSLTSFNSHAGKGSISRDVVGDLMSKLWMCDVFAVGNNSSCDTYGAGWWSVVEDEENAKWD